MLPRQVLLEEEPSLQNHLGSIGGRKDANDTFANGTSVLIAVMPSYLCSCEFMICSLRTLHNRLAGAGRGLQSLPTAQSRWVLTFGSTSPISWRCENDGHSRCCVHVLLVTLLICCRRAPVIAGDLRRTLAGKGLLQCAERTSCRAQGEV